VCVGAVSHVATDVKLVVGSVAAAAGSGGRLAVGGLQRWRDAGVPLFSLQPWFNRCTAHGMRACCTDRIFHTDVLGISIVASLGGLSRRDKPRSDVTCGGKDRLCRGNNLERAVIVPMRHQCFVCQCDFPSEDALDHHLQIAYRRFYACHAILQQEPPCPERVPVRYYAKLTALQRFSNLVEEMAGEDGIEGVGKTNIFKWQPTFPDQAAQRSLETQIPSIRIPCFDAPTMTVVHPTHPPKIFNPYTTSGARPSDFHRHEESGIRGSGAKSNQKRRSGDAVNVNPLTSQLDDDDYMR
jgi:hypothetical protein